MDLLCIIFMKLFERKINILRDFHEKPIEKMSFRELEKLMQEAVEEENYEYAAELRDRLKSAK